MLEGASSCSFNIGTEDVGAFDVYRYSCTDTFCTLDSIDTVTASDTGSVVCSGSQCAFASGVTVQEEEPLPSIEEVTESIQTTEQAAAGSPTESTTSSTPSASAPSSTSSTPETPKFNEFNYGSTTEDTTDTVAGAKSTPADTAFPDDAYFAQEESSGVSYLFVFLVLVVIVTLSSYLGYTYYYKPKMKKLPQFKPSTPTLPLQQMGKPPMKRRVNPVQRIKSAHNSLAKNNFNKKIGSAFSGESKDLKRLTPKRETQPKKVDTPKKTEKDDLKDLEEMSKKKKKKDDPFDDLGNI